MVKFKFESGCLIALCIYIGVSSAFAAEEMAEHGVSLPCSSLSGVTAQDLRLKQTLLETELWVKRSELESAAKEEPASVQRKERLKKEIQTVASSLAEVIYQQECFRSEWEKTAPQRGNEQLIEITTYYATNRKPSGSTNYTMFYGYDSSRTLEFGKVSVTVPNTHTLGELELPTLWKLERTVDPSKHFAFKNLIPLHMEDALQAMALSLQNSRRKSLLLFVHGYRVNFAEAALRSAQLALDLRFPGLVLFYSWPSKGTAGGYIHDEEAAELSEQPLDGLLDQLTALPIDDIYILAHSMGNRIVANTLADRERESRPITKVRELLLAAPDINSEIFLTKIAPGLERLSSVGKTIYASSNDVALRASKSAHEFRRVGETAGGVQTYKGFTTIDTSRVAPIWRAWGHSYMFDSSPVLGDMEDLLVWQRAIAERKLIREGAHPDFFWSIAP